MTTAIPPVIRRRRWPWVLAAVLLAPFLIAGVAAASYLTLSRDAAILRREVMAATQADWQTKIQLSAGRLTFWALRTGLAFVPDGKVHEAREALRAVRSVSVGVYRSTATAQDWSRDQLFNETDRKMRERGWSRLVGVADRRDNVLVYVPAKATEIRDVCLAVLNGRELIIVSATLNSEALANLVKQHLPRERRKLPRSLLS